MNPWISSALAYAVLQFWMVPDITPDSYPESWVDQGRGKTYVLYRKHDVKAMSQGPVGSCVGCATAKALELMHGEAFSAEWLYGVSRDQFGSSWKSAGSYCAWAAHICRDVGVLPSYNYSLLGYDLRAYSAALAKNWARGPPSELEWVSANYKSPGYIKIDTWKQLRDAISQEIPVICGSNVGFGATSLQVRDRTGMLRSRWWSKWNHAMVFCGVSDGRSKRALLLNSWGEDWVTGPKWIGDEPEGSFWISKKDCEKMLRQGDCWAILPIEGLE